MTAAQGHAGAVAVSVVVNVLLLASAVVGLVVWRTIYKAETANLVDSAAAQDVVSVAVCVLLIVGAGITGLAVDRPALTPLLPHLGTRIVAWSLSVPLSSSPCCG